MFANDNEIYEYIGKILNQSVQDEWINIEVDIERTDGSIGLNSKYISHSGEKKYPNGRYILNNTRDAFEELYQMMIRKNKIHKWNRVKVTLSNEDNFNIKFEWDQELYDEIEKLNNEYDPRWDDSLSQEEKIEKYNEMIAKGELA